MAKSGRVFPTNDAGALRPSVLRAAARPRNHPALKKEKTGQSC